MLLRPLLLGLLTLTLLSAGCRKPEVVAYTVPKEKETSSDPHGAEPHGHDAAGNPVFPGSAPMAGPAAAGAAAGNMAATAVPTANGPELSWTAPAHWKSKPPTPSRKATFTVTGDAGAEAELSITAFGGDVGGELANVNRWRSQPPFQLPPVGQAEMAAAVKRTEHNGLKFGVLELESAASPKSRLIGAWVPFAGSTWFFKFTGPDALVAREKAAFLAFLETVKPAATP